MRVYRWWSYCGIAFALMVFVSCTQGQVEQVLQNKTQDMISGPCPPGSGPVSAAPEFCLYVTELRIVNRDSETDVSLTIANRSGRRIYVSLSNPPYLTDSSGAKWNSWRRTGIDYWGAVPIPVDPNVDSQIALLFSRSGGGQVPPDLTFSMRGDIAISPIDSRGEPIRLIGTRPQAVRGFNFSGLRQGQQQAQSSGSAK